MTPSVTFEAPSPRVIGASVGDATGHKVCSEVALHVWCPGSSLFGVLGAWEIAEDWLIFTFQLDTLR